MPDVFLPCLNKDDDDDDDDELPKIFAPINVKPEGRGFGQPNGI